MALALAALAAGLLGGVHCAGMCGGIAGSLAASSRGSPWARNLAFNAGRIASYAFAGAIAGATGGLVAAAGPVMAAQLAMFVVANVLMLMLGLYVAGWSRAVLRLEGAGVRLWRGLEPARRRLLPINTTAKAVGAGMVWGWVPCGLVYGLLPLALASGSAASGALVMAAFGLGTAPSLLAAGLAARRVLAIRHKPWVRRICGTALVALAIAGLARSPGLAEALHAGWICVAP